MTFYRCRLTMRLSHEWKCPLWALLLRDNIRMIKMPASPSKSVVTPLTINPRHPPQTTTIFSISPQSYKNHQNRRPESNDHQKRSKTLLVGLEPTTFRLEVWRATIAPKEQILEKPERWLRLEIRLIQFIKTWIALASSFRTDLGFSAEQATWAAATNARKHLELSMRHLAL